MQKNAVAAKKKAAKQGDFETALKLLWVVVALNPTVAGDEVLKAMRYIKDACERHPKIALGKSDSMTPFVAPAARDLREFGEELELGVQCLDSALGLSPNNLDAKITKALLLHLKMKYSEAIRCYTEAIQFDSSESEYYYYRGDSFLCMGNPSAAIEDFSVAIKLQSEDPQYYLKRGIAKSNMMNFSEAIKDFSLCIQLQPHDAASFFNRAMALKTSRKFGSAINDFTSVLSILPQHSGALYNRGVCYYHKSMEDIASAVEKEPRTEYKQFLLKFKK